MPFTSSSFPDSPNERSCATAPTSGSPREVQSGISWSHCQWHPGDEHFLKHFLLKHVGLRVSNMLRRGRYPLAEMGKQPVFLICTCLEEESDQTCITNSHSHEIVITLVERESHQNKSSPRALYFIATIDVTLAREIKHRLTNTYGYVPF